MSHWQQCPYVFVLGGMYWR